jgi:uracil phosphoribosyltransferase
MPGPPNLTVVRHPLVQHKITRLRDRRTGHRDFRDLIREVGALMAYEVLRDLPTEEVEVETPLETTTGPRVREEDVVLVPVLRAGLGMLEGFTTVLPGARIGHVGLYRDEETLQPVQYYFNVPRAASRHFVVVDPMLGTGGSSAATITMLKEHGARAIRLAVLVAGPEGVDALERAHPDVPVFTAALDRGLNEHGFILPGLGDAGDRIFGSD